MLIFKIIGIALLTCISVLILKQSKPEFALILSIVSGVIIILMSLEGLGSIFKSFDILIEKTGINKGLFSTILKIVGIGYCVEFGASICTDSGASSLADKLLLAGKITILTMSMPILLNIVDIITGLLP